MLTEKNEVDQLFRRKLGKYEQTPPAFVWESIAQQLDIRQKGMRYAWLKAAMIAAVIVASFVAGWMMNKGTDKSGNRPENAVNRIAVKTNQGLQSNQLTLQSSEDKARSGNGSAQPVVENSAFPGQSTAVSSALMGKAGKLGIQNPGELPPINREKNLRNNFQQNYSLAEKIIQLHDPSLSTNLAVSACDTPTTNPESFSAIASDKGIATQISGNVKKRNRRWSLKAEFAPVLNSHRQNYGQINDLYPTGYQNYSVQKITAEKTFSTGILAGYQIGKRFIIESGLVYNNFGQTVKDADEYLLRQQAEFIGIPLQVNCKLTDRRFGIGFTGGISTNFLVGSKADLFVDGDRVGSGEDTNLRNVNYSGSLGLELAYGITNRITLTAEPRFIHYINGLSTDKSIDYQTNQLEIVTGLTYSFN